MGKFANIQSSAAICRFFAVAPSPALALVASIAVSTSLAEKPHLLKVWLALALVCAGSIVAAGAGFFGFTTTFGFGLGACGCVGTGRAAIAGADRTGRAFAFGADSASKSSPLPAAVPSAAAP